MGVPRVPGELLPVDWKRLPLSSHEGFRSPMNLLRRRVPVALAIFLIFAYVGLLRKPHQTPFHLSDYEQWGPFRSFNLNGFINLGMPSKDGCDALRYDGTIGVQHSFHVPDNLTQIAISMDSHHLVEYPDFLINNENLTAERVVQMTWGRCSGSSAWLPDQNVFLVVTRAFFHDGPVISYPKVSFLRGQVFNSRWEHLENHTIKWQDKSITFPTIFEVGATWVEGEEDKHLYGPEDPRVIVEDFKGAEPVVVFNMGSPKVGWNRAMHIHRPFSGQTVMFEVKNRERRAMEKNWAPFFGAPEPLPEGIPRQPSEYLHFLYSFKPMRVLKCHLRCGDCELVYEQTVPAGISQTHDEKDSFLSGGTNFLQVPTSSLEVHPDVRVYAAFARTQVQRDCGDRFYRPEFVVLVSFRQHFHLAFTSVSTDFGDALLPERDASEDPCEKGHILIPNSITRIDSAQGEDVLELMFSVDDITVQMARMHGLLAFVRGLPQFKHFLRTNGPLQSSDADYREILTSWAGDETRACTVESAVNDTLLLKAMSDKLKLGNKNEDKPIEIDKSQELVSKIERDAWARRQKLKQRSNLEPRDGGI